MSELWDAPNQQVVRRDASPPWQEGTGGEEQPVEADPLDGMTKDELIAYADEHGVETTSTMTKAEVRAAIDEASAA